MTDNYAEYLAGRKKYSRPQGMLWADNAGTLSTNEATGKSYYVPTGNEINSDILVPGDFLILSDDNRSPIEFSQQRIENRRRTVNGRMRSYHIADKLQISVSWDMLPSRSFSNNPNFNTTTGKPGSSGYDGIKRSLPNTEGNYLYQYTTDGGAGGAEILDWYENNKGSFWVYLSYDKYPNFESRTDKYAHLAEYSQVVEMYIADFNYSVQKRGATNFDFWNISVTLEEA
jgi:hypothetical protein